MSHSVDIKNANALLSSLLDSSRAKKPWLAFLETSVWSVGSPSGWFVNRFLQQQIEVQTQRERGKKEIERKNKT